MFSDPFFPYCCFWPVCISAYSSGSSVLHIRSPFRALTLALAGTLGVGNIVGVAVALTAGGRGALFWMVLSAFATMLLKYCEIFLAVRYRRSIKNDKDTIYYGGPMYYISESPASPRLRRNCACLFAVLCIFASFTLGNMI